MSSATTSNNKYKKTHKKRIALEINIDYFDLVLKPTADSNEMGVNTLIKQAIQHEITELTGKVSSIKP